jgi:hypothetical protein
MEKLTKESFTARDDDGKEYLLTSWVKLSPAPRGFGGAQGGPIEGKLLHYQIRQGIDVLLQPDESFKIASSGKILRRVNVCK